MAQDVTRRDKDKVVPLHDYGLSLEQLAKPLDLGDPERRARAAEGGAFLDYPDELGDPRCYGGPQTSVPAWQGSDRRGGARRFPGRSSRAPHSPLRAPSFLKTGWVALAVAAGFWLGIVLALLDTLGALR